MNEFLQRWRILIAYNGSKYAGWQRQKTHMNTIQQILEMNFHRVYGESEVFRVSSRTDRGVHALANTCDVALPQKKNIRRLIEHINRKKEDIFITGVSLVDWEWNAKNAATERTYIYRIVKSKKIPKELGDLYWFQNRNLNVEKMQRAAEILVGKHDFSSFMSKSSSVFLFFNLL